MSGYRWIRGTARVVVGLLTMLPAIALAIALLVDFGPEGEPRLSIFPVALLAFADFTWTCARNSLLFATALTAFSLAVGMGIGLAMSGRPYRGRGVLRTAVASMLAAPPACLALGWIGLLDSHPAWSIPLQEAASGRLSLESWHGWPAWLLWIWASAPGAVALVAIATAAVHDRIEPSWRDAARLAGAGRFRTWRSVTWPSIRPAAARAAAIIFPLALLEPGAPLVLGLRRTLAYQIVEAAGRPEPFPGIAIWTAMAAVFSMAGRWLLRWWGGPLRVEWKTEPPGVTRSPRPTPRAAIPPAVLSGMLLVVALALGWLPVLGLPQTFAGSAASPTWSVGELLRRATAPPVPQIVMNSLTLGLEVGVGVLSLAWMLRPDPGTRLAPTLASRLVGRFALMPPMVQGVGLLATVSLGSHVLGSLKGLSGPPGPLARIGELAPELAVGRNPWPILSLAVGLSVASRLLTGWRRAAESRPEEARSGLEAALLAGSTFGRARSAAARWPGRTIGGLLLAVSLSAVNLTPALFFTPWADGRTAAPAILILADGQDDARVQAGALALFLIAGHLAGLCAARLAPAPPPEWDGDPP